MTEPSDIHTLTGAYAVDALPTDERERFEAHLAVCDACADEVVELQAIAAGLGSGSPHAPPPELRERILREIAATPQERPPAGAAELSDVPAADDTIVVSVDLGDERTGQVIASPSRGAAVFVADGWQPAPHEHTYELWLLHDVGATPVGVFDPDEGGRVTHVITGDVASAAAIGVTVEPVGGSPQPTSDPVMVLDLGR